MSNLHFGKSKFSKFISGKGFYVALAVCVVGAGAAAWVAVDKTLGNITQENQNYLSDQNTNSTTSSLFPDLEEAGEIVSSVEKNESSQSASSSSNQSSSQAQQSDSSKQSETSKKDTGSSTGEKPLFMLPVTGDVIKEYSNNELVKSETLGDWRTHDGVDIKGKEGTQVKAAANGTVSEVTEDAMWGMMVVIDHGGNMQSIYCNLNKAVNVKKGDKVELGTIIGSIGNTALAEVALQPHLHFAMKENGKYVDPLKCMDKVS